MSSLPATYDMVAYRGDTFARTFRLLDSTGTPVDLTGLTSAAWAVSRSNGQTPVVLPLVVGPDPGVITLGLPAGMAADSYSYDVELTDGSSGEVKTWLRGLLIVDQDVTNRDDL